MLRLLKQARAFGVGMVLATQNPVDMDYKALSNAGSWFIGKLGTDQDKQRLLDGLTSAMGTGLNRSEYDNLISALGKRVFLLRNVHDKQPTLFQTRWAMNYLAGPATRNQIPALNALVNAQPTPQTTDKRQVVDNTTLPQQAQPPITAPSSQPQATSHPLSSSTLPGAETRPPVPTNVSEYFLPTNLTISEAKRVTSYPMHGETVEHGILYRPVLIAQTDVRYSNRKYNLNTNISRTFLLPEPDPRGVSRWERYEINAVSERDFDRTPLPNARFMMIDAPMNSSRSLKGLSNDLVDWAYHNSDLTVQANEELKVYRTPNMSDAQFKRLLATAADEKEDVEIEKAKIAFQKKIASVEKKLKAEERELEEDEAELSGRKREELTKHAETIIGLFTGRRRSVSSSLTKRRMTEKAKADVRESKEAIESFQEEMAELAEEQQAAVSEIEDKWDTIEQNITEIEVSPYKKDILVALFGVAWLPHYLLEVDGRMVELPAFQADEL